MSIWRSGVLSGLLFGVLFVLFMHYLNSEGWTTAAIAGAVTGIGFGIVMALMYRRLEGQLSSLDGDLTQQQRRAAMRASRRGSVPIDPAIRTAALATAQNQLERYQSGRLRVALVIAPIFLTLSGVLHLLDHDHQWSRAIVPFASAAALGWGALEPRRLRRRIQILSAAD